MATNLLQVTGVSVSFGGLQALADVSLHVPEGTIVGLIGPNGAGKTTLFNVISGLQRSNAGSIHFDGRDVTKLATSRRAALGMGRSFQHLGLILDETVAVNLMAAEYLGARYGWWDIFFRPWRWWREERRLKGRALDTAERYGLVDSWDSRVQDLSFGAARFVELACVLVEEPKLMLLDEPTTGLDSGEVDQLLAALRVARESGMTILLVAHDVRFVMDLCDHVFVLAEGRLLAEGSPREIQNDPAVIEAYLGRSA